MSLKERTINVDIMRKEYTKLKYKQGDSNQTLKFKFYKNGSELDLTGYVAGIFYEKSNNEILEKTGTISSNTVTTTITSGILNTSGIVKTEIFLTKDTEVTISFTILIEVESSIDKNAAVQEKEEWDIIKDLLINGNNISMIDDSLTATNKTWSSSKIDSQIKEIETRIDNIGGSSGGNVDLSGYVTKETGNANQITFADGQTFQDKLNNGELRGSQGIQGEQGQKGVDGITPSISIGNVRTLEPTQQATVTKRGTDANPIFDFGIPKGVKGDKGEDGVGGATESSSNLIAKYVHEGNKEIHPVSLDLSTGVYTCNTPHGISSPTDVLVIPKENGGLRKIPSELFDTRKKYKAVPIDDKTFRITKEGTELTYSEENNTGVDVTKFYFDCFVERILQIQLEKPCKEVEVLVSGITGSGDCYISPYYEGFDENNLQAFSGTFYKGIPSFSSNAYHGTPRFFSIKADFSILNSMLISKGINAQYGFTGRTVKNATVNINAFSDFARNNFDKLRLGSRSHTWGLTNGLTVLIYNKGGNTI